MDPIVNSEDNEAELSSTQYQCKNYTENVHSKKSSDKISSAYLDENRCSSLPKTDINIKDQTLKCEYGNNVDNDDDELIFGEIKNGCDRTRLNQSIEAGLQSKLQSVSLDSKTPEIQYNSGTVACPKISSKAITSMTAQQYNTNNQKQDDNDVGNEHIEYKIENNQAISSIKDGNELNMNELPKLQSDQGISDLINVNQRLLLTQHVYESANTNELPPPNGSLASFIASSSACSTLLHNISFNEVKKTSELTSTYINIDLQKQRQLTFLKSQSLDFYNDDTILSNAYQNLLFNQLPEIIECRTLEQQQKLNCTNQDTNKFTKINHKASINSIQNTSLNYSLKNLNTSFPSSSLAAECIDISAEDVPIRSIQKLSVTSKLQSLESRPIYPNVPYSPYCSPIASPRSNRRRPPLRESRRISIEQSGSFLQLNQYKLMDQIGQGSYGLVKLAYSEEDSTHYAMKILSKRRLVRQAGLMTKGPKKRTSPLDRVYREIAVLKKLDHPNVVKLVEVLDDPVEDALYMVFELVKQGEVLSIPTNKPLTEEQAWHVFRETLLGLEYLHYQRIIHADLKPGNLLLTESGHVKIADLGVCNEFLGKDATMTNGSTAGTPAFRAPETLFLGQNVYCGKAADIWALGVTLYSLVYGNVPFVTNSIPLLYEKIQSEMLTFPATPKISNELKHCIELMLTKDPKSRITLPKLKEHVWVTANGKFSLPTEDENCRLVQISDDDINTVVRSIPKLDTLILIKTMLKKHSFGNPFLKGISGRAPQYGGSRFERFVRAGRSNSAPGSYHMVTDRQQSGDNILPALTEQTSNLNNDKL